MDSIQKPSILTKILEEMGFDNDDIDWLIRKNDANQRKKLDRELEERASKLKYL